MVGEFKLNRTESPLEWVLELVGLKIPRGGAILNALARSLLHPTTYSVERVINER